MPWKEDGPMERRVELIREWSGGGAGSQPGAAHPAATTDGGDHRAGHRNAAPEGLGTTQVAGQTRGSLTGDEAARSQHHRGSVAEQGTEPRAQAAGPDASARPAVRRSRTSQP